MSSTALSHDLIVTLLSYDPDSGKLFWLPRKAEMFRDAGKRKGYSLCAAWNTRWGGKPALYTPDVYGYQHGTILGKTYKAHRVAWCLLTGDWPDGFIDHKNGDRSDNSATNLREATRTENQQNTTSRSGSTSPYLGVSWERRCSRWNVRIKINGKQKHIGNFECQIEAAKAYDRAALKYFGEFANPNFPQGVSQ